MSNDKNHTCHLVYNIFLIILFPFLFFFFSHYVGTYDSKSGFTVSFSHIEDSGYFDCRLQDDPETYITFQIMINEQREFISKSFIGFVYYIQ